MNRDFILPEFWCILINDMNSSTLKKYWKSLPDVKSGFTFYKWLLSDINDGTYLNYNDDNIPAGFTEITYDQFKQYVLKQPCKTTKKENNKYLIKVLKRLNIK